MDISFPRSYYQVDSISDERERIRKEYLFYMKAYRVLSSHDKIKLSTEVLNIAEGFITRLDNTIERKKVTK